MAAQISGVYLLLWLPHFILMSIPENSITIAARISGVYLLLWLPHFILVSITENSITIAAWISRMLPLRCCSQYSMFHFSCLLTRTIRTKYGWVVTLPHWLALSNSVNSGAALLLVSCSSKTSDMRFSVFYWNLYMYICVYIPQTTLAAEGFLLAF